MDGEFLKELMRATMESATPLSKRVFGRRPMLVQDVERFLHEAPVATLITIKPDGRPHASIGSFCHHDGKLYVYSNRASARHRHIIRNGHVAVTVVDGRRRQVILEGAARILGVASDLTSHPAADAFRTKYGHFAGDRGSASCVVEITPNKLFTYRGRG